MGERSNYEGKCPVIEIHQEQTDTDIKTRDQCEV